MNQYQQILDHVLARHGEHVELVRLGSPDVVVPITMARSTRMSGDALEHEIIQEIRKYKISITPLAGSVFADPASYPKKNDRIHRDGKFITITLAERMVALGDVIGFEISTEGEDT